jgi:pyruvate dehydrogenase E2 component (dihydrolipoyllysine-residue acetyltransferase)
MSVEITIPRLGWSMDEGIFVEWIKKDGEYVTAGEPIFLMETEKALQEIESVDAGILHILPDTPKEGDVVKVGTLIGYLLEEGEEAPEFQPSVKTSAQSKELHEPSSSDTTLGDVSTRKTVTPIPSTQKTGSSKVVASPSVRRLARELGVDHASMNLSGTISIHDVHRAAQKSTVKYSPALNLTSTTIPERNTDPSLPKISPRAARTAKRFNINWTALKGSGHDGRIRERDVLAASGNRDLPDGILISASPVRKLIAERLAQSARTTVPVTLTTKVSVDAILQNRSERKKQAESSEIVPAYHDYIMRAVAKVLQDYPSLNSCWMNGEIFQPKGIHIGLAVDTENGLKVPVVRDADQKSLLDIANASSKLISRARNRKLTNKECSGGTFTISNLGSFGIDGFTPVINLGESAILGLGTIRKLPECASDGSIIWIQQMTLSLTFDHQIVDGAPAAKFLQEFCSHLENPAMLLKD